MASETKSMEDKMKKIDVSSPTSVLAQNAVLLPSGVARLKQSDGIQNRKDVAVKPTSSGSATGNPRNKTALAPGHSLMDWIRLGSSGVDLTGVGGVPRSVTPAELAKHNKQNDAWIAIRGEVFNVSRYMDFHPGGISELMKGVGKDATKLFDEVHAWVNYRSILHKCVVGTLSRGGSVNSDKAITSAITIPTMSSTLLSSCTSKPAEKIPDSVASSFKFAWKQTTSNITFSYLALTNLPAVNYQMTRISDVKHRLDVVFDSNTLTYELDLNAGVKWPPKWKQSCEPTEVDFTFAKAKPEIWKTYGTRSFSYEPTSNARIYTDYEVVSNTSLCPVVNLLMLRAKDYLEIIPAGRHLEAKMTVMEMDVSRMYTPVPPCLHPEDIVSGYTPDCICLMVKRYPDGALSPSITALQAGQTLALSHCLGTFIVESFDAYTNMHMLAAGTGLTAMLAVIQRSLGRRTVSTINLICFNKDEDNIFYAPELDKVTKSGKLKVCHVLSQASESWSGTRGTVSDKLLTELVGPRTAQGCVLSCGPTAFMDAAKQSLESLGWKSSQMHEFND